MTGVDNTLKQRVRVDGTYTDFVIDTGAEVSIVTEATSRILSLELEKSDLVLSGADGSPLSVLGKSEVLLENKRKFAKTTVYVIKGLQCNLLGLNKLRKLGLLAVENKVCRIEAVSIQSSVTTGELTTDSKGFASASAPSTTSMAIGCFWIILKVMAPRASSPS